MKLRAPVIAFGYDWQAVRNEDSENRDSMERFSVKRFNKVESKVWKRWARSPINSIPKALATKQSKILNSQEKHEEKKAGERDARVHDKLAETQKF